MHVNQFLYFILLFQYGLDASLHTHMHHDSSEYTRIFYLYEYVYIYIRSTYLEINKVVTGLANQISKFHLKLSEKYACNFCFMLTNKRVWRGGNWSCCQPVHGGKGKLYLARIPSLKHHMTLENNPNSYTLSR